ncbi:GNAT family N-acetyltransferase [Streptomyces sp. NPDC050418]|uniref:GNAT family N-acetyltransferase n=1 Tax=Streptomyces sp. NPDC050418 TaxID=3365612 RepID=UPI003794CDDF
MTEVDNQRREELRSGLRATNSEASPTLRGLRDTGVLDEVPLHVYAFTPEGDLAGGVVAHTANGWLELDLLWVDAPHRGTGLGSAVVAEAESLARARGCAWSKVWTWDFQAPGFYGKQGYEVQCVLEDHPPGVRDFFLTKRLG